MTLDGLAIETQAQSRSAARRRLRDFRASVLVSAGLHLTLLAAMATYGWRQFLLLPPAAPTTINTVAAAAPPTGDVEGNDAAPDAARELPGEIGALSLQTLIQSEIERQLSQSRTNPPEREWTRLDEIAARLERISNAEEVAAMSDRIGKSLGLTPRASAPAQAPAEDGEFDHRTAQLHNVEQASDDEGHVAYFGVLVDQAGRTMTVELSREEGEELTRLFELMRKFPLVEQVYRQLVMSLLDGMTPARPPAQAARPVHPAASSTPAIPTLPE